MQSLIPLLAGLALTSATHLALVPYGYLLDPLPAYQQSQNTRTGEHSYSYSGGPSAKQEVRGPDGVTRGSYSYVDAHGILQSVFYVADEAGFRVAATNLPTDQDVQEAVLLAGRRRKRSLEETDRNSHQEPSEPKLSSWVGDLEDQAPSESLLTTVTVPPSQSEAKEAVKTQETRAKDLPVLGQASLGDLGGQVLGVKLEQAADKAPVLGQVGARDDMKVSKPLVGPLLASESPVQVSSHGNIQGSLLQVALPGSRLAQVEPVILTDGIPLSTSHQSRVDVHRNSRLEVGSLIEAPLLPYRQNPVQNLVLARDAPVLSTETTVSSHGLSQSHDTSRIALKIEDRPTFLVQPLILAPLPLARFSHHRSQVHAS
ncbi:hypothetical protein KM043_001224 [Ampulex compressa]|nr:hypothetical protein KM043_001224 [Ampulex compressa]